MTTGSEHPEFEVFDPVLLPGKLVFGRRRSFIALRPPDNIPPIFSPPCPNNITFVINFPTAQAGGTLISTLAQIKRTARTGTNESATKAIAVSTEVV